VRALPAAEGVAEVMVPGEPEDRTEAERRRDGIPLPAGTVANLRSVAARFRVPLPRGL
jgi:LDH2 family malate/lactate/ureidoglycolate dehydrogenase